ncbi:MAG: tetratricopeptide repeat protein [Kouleothrix sp.]
MIPLTLCPLDLDTFTGSERFMAGTRLGAAFSQGIRAYLRAAYSDAIEHFKAALIAAYVEGEEQAQIFERERAIIYLYIGNALAFQDDWEAALREYLEAVQTDPQLAKKRTITWAWHLPRAAKLDRAIAALKEALEHNPLLYEAHFSLGRCYPAARRCWARLYSLRSGIQCPPAGCRAALPIGAGAPGSWCARTG